MVSGIVSARATQPGNPAAREKEGRYKEGDIGADHKNVAVGKVDQGQYAIDQSVAKGDQGVEAPPLQGINDVLNNGY